MRTQEPIERSQIKWEPGSRTQDSTERKPGIKQKKSISAINSITAMMTEKIEYNYQSKNAPFNVNKPIFPCSFGFQMLCLIV